MGDELTMLPHITIGLTAVSRLWSISFCLMRLFPCRLAAAPDRPCDELLDAMSSLQKERRTEKDDGKRITEYKNRDLKQSGVL